MTTPSNQTLDERTKRMELDISDIKKDVKKILNCLPSFITKDEAEKKFAGKWTSNVLKWLGALVGGGVLTIAGKALIFYLKNGQL